jgi:hypothetical protein
VHGALAKRLYAAFLARDTEALARLLTEHSSWELCGRSALAGLHVGPEAILRVLRGLMRLRPMRDDAYDIAESEYHAVLMTRLVGSGLDSDHAIVVVAEEDRLARAFHYVFDLYAFDEAFRPDDDG